MEVTEFIALRDSLENSVRESIQNAMQEFQRKTSLLIKRVYIDTVQFEEVGGHRESFIDRVHFDIEL